MKFYTLIALSIGLAWFLGALAHEDAIVREVQVSSNVRLFSGIQLKCEVIE